VSEKTTYGPSVRAALVEVVCGVAMVVFGVILQVNGTTGDTPNPTLTVSGGILVAVGGVLLSWMASRILAERQAVEASEDSRVAAQSALEAAQAEVDEKLNNLSRVLGQAAGQIAQAVEKVDAGLVSEVTGFELISQANRMIYGQVSEIAVIRKSSFDPAYLLDTAATLDELARELTSRTHSDDASAERESLVSVRERIETVRVGLKTAGGSLRVVSDVDTTCPYCDRSNRVSLGTTPGDTASATCKHCGEIFNAHRNAAGDAFTRRRGPQVGGLSSQPTPRWALRCPGCDHVLTVPKNGKGERQVVCPECFAALNVDPGLEVVSQDGIYEARVANDVYRSGSRPKAPCPVCGAKVNMPLRRKDGFFGFCVQDRIALTITEVEWGNVLTDK